MGFSIGIQRNGLFWAERKWVWYRESRAIFSLYRAYQLSNQKTICNRNIIQPNPIGEWTQVSESELRLVGDREGGMLAWLDLQCTHSLFLFVLMRSTRLRPCVCETETQNNIKVCREWRLFCGWVNRRFSLG